jgi:hypothetical protein
MKALLRSARRAYTVMEVMMSIAVLGLGAMGVIALQKTTLLANDNARKLATATSIAQSWIERLRIDALQWNNPAGIPDLVADTQWLTVSAAAPVWLQPGTFSPAGSSDSDVLGADNYANDPMPQAVAAFCTQLRLTKFATAAMPNFDKLIRVEVRVLWSRDGHKLTCTALNDTNPTDLAARNLYGVVYMTSAVQQNTAP